MFSSLCILSMLLVIVQLLLAARITWNLPKCPSNTNLDPASMASSSTSDSSCWASALLAGWLVTLSSLLLFVVSRGVGLPLQMQPLQTPRARVQDLSTPLHHHGYHCPHTFAARAPNYNTYIRFNTTGRIQEVDCETQQSFDEQLGPAIADRSPSDSIPYRMRREAPRVETKHRITKSRTHRVPRVSTPESYFTSSPDSDTDPLDTDDDTADESFTYDRRKSRYLLQPRLIAPQNTPAVSDDDRHKQRPKHTGTALEPLSISTNLAPPTTTNTTSTSSSSPTNSSTQTMVKTPTKSTLSATTSTVPTNVYTTTSVDRMSTQAVGPSPRSSTSANRAFRPVPRSVPLSVPRPPPPPVPHPPPPPVPRPMNSPRRICGGIKNWRVYGPETDF